MRQERFSKRSATPTDVRSSGEIVVFAGSDGRFKVVDHAGAVHTFAYVEELGGGGGGGLQFDTYPQAGQYLYVETGGSADSPSGYGQEFFDDSGNGINLATASGGNIDLSSRGGGHIELSSTQGIQINEENTSGFGSIIINSGFGKAYFLAHDDLDIESAEWGFLHFRSTGILAKTDHRVDIEAETVASFRALHGSVDIEASGVSDSSISLVANGLWKYNIFGNPDSFMGDKPGHLFLLNTDADGSRTEIHDLGAAGGAILRIDVAADGTVTYHMKAGATWATDL